MPVFNDVRFKRVQEGARKLLPWNNQLLPGGGGGGGGTKGAEAPPPPPLKLIMRCITYILAKILVSEVSACKDITSPCPGSIAAYLKKLKVMCILR